MFTNKSHGVLFCSIPSNKTSLLAATYRFPKLKVGQDQLINDQSHAVLFITHGILATRPEAKYSVRPNIVQTVIAKYRQLHQRRVHL